MKILYYIYQICIAFAYFISADHPYGNRHYCRFLLGRSPLLGIYYPGKIWSQLICLFLLIPVKDLRGAKSCMTKLPIFSYLTIRGSFDIFLIYGFIGRNFLSG